MKITYTAPNRSHHYLYAKAIHELDALHAFVSGFSRFSPRAPLPEISDKLKRHDFFQNFYLGASTFKFPYDIRKAILKLANLQLDYASYAYAKKSDAFIFYRTQGYHTTNKIKKDNIETLCIMEEVNSHVENYHSILLNEYREINTKIAFEFDPEAKLRLEMYERCDAILCPSDFVKRSFISKGFDESKLIKVNFGFPPTDINYDRALKTKDDVFRILFVGQIHYRKGLRYAIEAFRKLKHPRKEFVIVGPTTLITGLEHTQIPSNVIFKGILKGKALDMEYKSANIFVLPSLEEGLALVQGEALSHGLPLIITTNTGGDDFIQEGREGFIVPIQSSEALYEKFQELADNVDLQNSMSINALDTAKRLGSWETAASKLLEEIQRIKFSKI